MKTPLRRSWGPLPVVVLRDPPTVALVQFDRRVVQAGADSEAGERRSEAAHEHHFGRGSGDDESANEAAPLPSVRLEIVAFTSTCKTDSAGSVTL
ncbi:MAG TPA: hypothetical protein VK474_04095 [Chthoniobacterales bacterium]|nr:hypothetical protein [Chthoniobacterales bacterium]